MAGRDITEGDGNVWALASDGTPIARGITEIGVNASTAIWQNTDMSYDVAIGGLPFFYAINDTRPYTRQTATYRKEQFDNSNEPGEQSLTGWWIRSQASFHSGTGIKFYDPATTDENGHYRFSDSRGLDVWTKGQVTLLKETANMTGVSSGTYKLISAVDGSTNKIIAWTPSGTTINNYTAGGTAVAYTAVTAISPSPLDTAIFAVATNGTNLFIADNDHIYTGPIATPTTGYTKYYDFQGDKTNVVLGWVKQRLVAGIDASIYELTNAIGTTHNLPATATYTHPNASWIWTSISEGGSAIYAAGYAGTTSAIYKFTLASNGSMPVLTSGVIAAQLPIGEYVNKIESYLGYLVIGTNKGIRVALISDTNGDITYGPLIIEAENTGLDFAFRDTYVWATGSIDGYPGLYRINLANELENLRFAYATDAYLDGVAGYATSVDFIGNSNQLAFTTSGSNGIAVQSATTLTTSGYLTTGNIRYGTLEPKNFKRLLGRGDFVYGSMTLETVDRNGVEYDHISYDSSIPSIEVGTSSPATAQEYVAYKFIIYRDGTDATKGPTFKGYQAKATIATPRQRIIQFPVYCFDLETDRYNSMIGYEGKAFEKILALEDIEEDGDVLTWQDLTTGESRQAVIEQITFTRMTPPDRRFDGFGGVINITIRTV